MNRIQPPPTPIGARHTLSRSNRPVGQLAKIPSASDVKGGSIKPDRRGDFAREKQKSIRFADNLEAPAFVRSKSMSSLQTKTPLKSILRNKGDRPVLSTKHLSMRNLNSDDDDLDDIFEASGSKETMEQQIRRLEEELKAAKEQLIKDAETAKSRPKKTAQEGGLRNTFQKRNQRNNNNNNSSSNNSNNSNNKENTKKKKPVRNFLRRLFGRKENKAGGDKPAMRKTKSVSNLKVEPEQDNSSPLINKRTQLRKAKSLKMNSKTEIGDMEEVKRNLLQPLNAIKTAPSLPNSVCKTTSLLIGNQSSFKDLNWSEHSRQSTSSAMHHDDASSVHSKESVKTSNKKKKNRNQNDDQSVSSRGSRGSKGSRSSRSRSRGNKSSAGRGDDWASAHSKVSATLDIDHSQEDASSTYESCYDELDASFSLSEDQPHIWSETPGQAKFVELDIRHLDQGSAKSLTYT